MIGWAAWDVFATEAQFSRQTFFLVREGARKAGDYASAWEVVGRLAALIGPPSGPVAAKKELSADNSRRPT